MLILEDTILEEIPVAGYEKVLYAKNESVGLHAIICIHNSTMGPTLGGTRIHPYASFEEALSFIRGIYNYKNWICIQYLSAVFKQY